MRILFGAFFLVLLVAGCSWNPTRDNPDDPASPYWEKPAERNRAPVIEFPKMMTDCRQIGDIGSFCAFTLQASVSDSDNNLLHDSVYAFIRRNPADTTVDADTLGLMTYDPLFQLFLIKVGQDEVPEHNLEELVGKWLLVRARDDSGAVAVDSTDFNAPERSWPIIRQPDGNPGTFARVETLLPRLSWNPWSHGSDHTYAIAVNLYGQDPPVWSVAGLAAGDTSVVVTDSLYNSAIEGSGVFYTWTLTVVDRRGNRVSATPEYFQCVVQPSHPASASLSPFVKRES